jgi:hypothetical protein
MNTTANPDGTDGLPAGPSAPFRVLALDGGGIRGYYTTRLLERFVAAAGGDPQQADFGAAFDLVVGTSTGALIGAGLASGVTLGRLSHMYRARGPAIFPKPAPIGRASLPWCSMHWRRPSASVDALRDALAPFHGTQTLAQLYARRGVALCITVTDLRSARGRVLATPHAQRHRDAADLTVIDACVASAAAPMLLPPARLSIGGQAERLLCDGGLWAASPVLFALGEALACAPADRDIEILSAGTCPMPLPSSVVARPPGTGIGLWIRGLRALQVAADAQALASVDFVHWLLPALGRTVRLLRLGDAAPSDADAVRVRLDRATPDAFAAMERLAQASADATHPVEGVAQAQTAYFAALLRAAAARSVPRR